MRHVIISHVLILKKIKKGREKIIYLKLISFSSLRNSEELRWNQKLTGNQNIFVDLFITFH